MRRFFVAVALSVIAIIIVAGCGTNEARMREIAREEAARVMSADDLETFGFGVAWEDEFSYAQGVKTGNIIWVAGQLPHGQTVDENGMPEFFMGDFEEQLRVTLDNIKAVLENYGATMDDVVFLQNFVVPTSRSGNSAGDYNPVAARLISEYFPNGLHAMTFAEVQGLYGDDQLVESNAIAVIKSSR